MRQYCESPDEAEDIEYVPLIAALLVPLWYCLVVGCGQAFPFCHIKRLDLFNSYIPPNFLHS